MYYNTILLLIAALTNVVGTTYAVLSILKLKPKEIYQALTIEGMDRNDETLLVQKKQARIGISLVAYAWMLQVLFSFVTVNTIKSFLIWLSVYVLITAVLCLLLSLSMGAALQSQSFVSSASSVGISKYIASFVFAFLII